MDKTLTIRIDAEQQAALGRTARMLGKTISEFVRETLEQAVAARSLATKTAHVKENCHSTLLHGIPGRVH